jgi:hypothetical protein
MHMALTPEHKALLERMDRRARLEQRLLGEGDRADAVSALVRLICDPRVRDEHYALTAAFEKHAKIQRPWVIAYACGRTPVVPERVRQAVWAGPPGNAEIAPWTLDELTLLLMDPTQLALFALVCHREMPGWWLDEIQAIALKRKEQSDDAKPA